MTDMSSFDELCDRWCIHFPSIEQLWPTEPEDWLAEWKRLRNQSIDAEADGSPDSFDFVGRYAMSIARLRSICSDLSIPEPVAAELAQRYFEPATTPWTDLSDETGKYAVPSNG